MANKDKNIKPNFREARIKSNSGKGFSRNKSYLSIAALEHRISKIENDNKRLWEIIHKLQSKDK
jgi:hypothetical protein